MTERGFMFLVMGFNGEKADAIKEQLLMHLSGWLINSVKFSNQNGLD